MIKTARERERERERERGRGRGRRRDRGRESQVATPGTCYTSHLEKQYRITQTWDPSGPFFLLNEEQKSNKIL